MSLLQLWQISTMRCIHSVTNNLPSTGDRKNDTNSIIYLPKDGRIRVICYWLYKCGNSPWYSKRSNVERSV